MMVGVDAIIVVWTWYFQRLASADGGLRVC